MFTNCLQFSHTLFTTDLYNILKDKGKGYSNRVLKVNNMKKYIELNNVTFEVKKVKGELHTITQVRSLEDCYAKPSSIKHEIYNDWFKWYMTDSDKYILKHFTIKSYNVNMFTLACDVYNMENEFIGQLYITKTRQEFWLA